ncbi:Protein of unknown function [Enhydrobacter aerosaccus]|uniref:DUF2726 domain-containing protein n=1 Tax=Enhydrobacter aerosaccus TaxID=225324 RepID=A0A1T4SI26_9HYPH|nr:DUF2726 domain-containing protein [Enhydrobacter aerosaccus]SKA27872.1 Protein of unknown function [Enhydrobacter aerosaccus]
MVLRLVNRYEEVAHGEIKASADRWNLSVYPKVRLADVIDLDSLGVVGELKRYGLQAHFDFVVCRNQWEPDYAVEFDGRYHSMPVQIARDQKKNQLCALARFPILRINSKYLSPTFGSMSLLAWLMDVYELQLGFEEQQARGAIPPDEPFDPFFFMSVDPKDERFPYWFSAKPRIRLQQLHKRGTIIDWGSSGFIGYDGNDIMRGIEYIRLSEAMGTYVLTAMRPQQFPLCFSDLLDEILCVQLADRVFSWLRGEVAPTPLAEIYAIADRMRQSLTLGRAHGYGPAVAPERNSA